MLHDGQYICYGCLTITARRFAQSNNLLGRASGISQLYLTDYIEKVLPWTQEKFDKVTSITYLWIMLLTIIHTALPEFN